MYGAEASGLGSDHGQACNDLAKGRPGSILHGALMEGGCLPMDRLWGFLYLCWWIIWCGAEHCYFNEKPMAGLPYDSLTDKPSKGFKLLSFGGIIPALESVMLSL